jgi:hypothetical protein
MKNVLGRRKKLVQRTLGGSLFFGAVVGLASGAFAGSSSVRVLDKTYDVGAGAFAYTEWELSGEPLASGLGLNLDVLKADIADAPDAFDFASGIDSYEYSEEAMFALNYQSQLGPHLVNGPVNAMRGGTMDAFGKRVIHLAQSVGFSPDEIAQNLYPLSFPLDKGMPEFAQPVDATSIGTDEISIKTHAGKEEKVKDFTPTYFRDYKTLGWTTNGSGLSTTPLAIGGEMLKDVMWAQDFLGGMHETAGGKEIDDVPSKDMDHDGKHALGKADDDGMNGMLLTEITWDKLLTLRNRFGYDGKTLGVTIAPAYDAKQQPIWFPNKLSVTLDKKNGVNSLGSLAVIDGGSSLRDNWMLMWALGEMYGLSDQRTANSNQKNSFLAVFDGDPFPAAPAANRGLETSKYQQADDPFTLTATLANLVMQDLDVLHFDAKANTFVDDWSNGRRGDKVTSYDAAYTITALQIYQRALEALPVGYASASSGKPLQAAADQRISELIKDEGNFIVSKLVGKDGLVADSFSIGKGPSSQQSLATQFAVIRGLSSAFVATGDEKYRTAARDIYLAVERRMFDKSSGLFDPTPGKPFEATPWTAGAVSAGLRELMTTLASRESEKQPQLSLENLTKRYTDWFHVVGRGIQLAEWLNDTGEHMVTGGDGDLNQNGIKSVTMAGGKYGTAAVMAARIEVTPRQ